MLVITGHPETVQKSHSCHLPFCLSWIEGTSCKHLQLHHIALLQIPAQNSVAMLTKGLMMTRQMVSSECCHLWCQVLLHATILLLADLSTVIPLKDCKFFGAAPSLVPFLELLQWGMALLLAPALHVLNAKIRIEVTNRVITSSYQQTSY